MKKFFYIFILTLFLPFISEGATYKYNFPLWQESGGTHTYITASNISKRPVRVKITLMDLKGKILVNSTSKGLDSRATVSFDTGENEVSKILSTWIPVKSFIPPKGVGSGYIVSVVPLAVSVNFYGNSCGNVQVTAIKEEIR